MLPNIFKNTTMEDFFKDDYFDRSFLYSPRSEVEKQDDGGYKISMALLGFTKNDLSLEVENNTITISGEITDDVPGFVTQKKFKKSWSLENLDEGSVEAKLENGILEVFLNSKEPEKTDTKKIKIQ